MIDIGAAIASASQGLTILKTVRQIDKTFDAAVYRSQIADVTEAFTNAKLALTDAREALAERDREIARLTASFAAKGALVKGDGDYNFFADEDGNPVGYPVCPKCEEVEGRVIQLKQSRYLRYGTCPACSKTYDPVTCYLPKGSAYRTAADQERAELDAEYSRSRNSGSNFY